MQNHRLRRAAAALTMAALTVFAVLAGTSVSHASSRLSYVASIVSVDSHNFATTEVGWNGSYPDEYGIVRTRSGSPGPWEEYGLDYVHDLDASAPANEVYIYSYAANNYLSAEFGWSGSQHGILQARSTPTTTGQWETFYLQPNGDGTTSIYVYDTSGGTTTKYYVSAEEGFTGDAYGTLRARATTVGSWEKFILPHYLSISNDYPNAWKNAGQDSFDTYWGLNRECVSYVAWALYQLNGGTGVPSSTGWDSIPGDWASYSPDVYDTYGNAGYWAGNAKSQGVSVNGTPTPGSVAEWNINSNHDTFPDGHVAMVTAVFPDGSIDIAQMNLRNNGLFSTLWIPEAGSSIDTSNGRPAFPVYWPDNFLHFNGR
jgi:hypothetical protein